MSKFSIEFATEQDVSLILHFIKELADYENLLSEVVATEEILHKSIFVDKKAEVIFAKVDNEPIGFALFFNNFSTFLGKPGIYLEDLYINPNYRGNGYGKKLLSFLADLAVKNDMERLEWWCLDWNKKSIDFYLKMGAESMDDWTVYRVIGKNLKDLAKKV